MHFYNGYSISYGGGIMISAIYGADVETRVMMELCVFSR